MHKNQIAAKAATSAPLPFVNSTSSPLRIWPVSKEPAPLPLALRGRHILTGEEFSQVELRALLDFASRLKEERKQGRAKLWLAGKQLAMVFEKPSLRTRVSFTVGMQDLGGHAIDIPSTNRKFEEPQDTARVLEGYCQAIMVRTFEQEVLETMARSVKVPIINALSNDHHPCQALADLLTIKERFGKLEGMKLAYVGDGNNVLHSLLLLGGFLGLEVHYACPAGYAPNEQIVFRAQERAKVGGGKIVAHATPQEAVKGAHAIYTDVWTSMGYEAENEKRLLAFQGYKVDEALHALADSSAVVMHCLPMNRDEEISGALADSKHSAIFEQSENRLHVQKALLVGLMSEWVRQSY